MKNRLLCMLLLTLLTPALAYANPVMLFTPAEHVLFSLLYLLPAILTEVAVGILILQLQKGWIRSAIILFLMNCITVSLLSLFLYLSNYWGHELTFWSALLTGEIVVVLVESLFMRLVFRCCYSRCLLASLAGNVASYLVGVLTILLFNAII